MKVKRNKGAEILFVADQDLTDLTCCVHFETRRVGERIYIKHPFLSEKLPLNYDDNNYLKEAQKVAAKESLDTRQQTGTVIVKDGKIIGRGANGSKYHELHGCERERLGIPTGQRYDLCEGCDPKNHAERKAIDNTMNNGHRSDLQGATAFLWGHWWCCEPCTTAMITTGIKEVVLSKNFTKSFLAID